MLPAGLVVTWIALLACGRRRGLLGSALAAAITGAVGVWSISQSRSSTAAIGFLFLPGAAALSGALALAFDRFRTHRLVALRLVAWACLSAAVGTSVVIAADGIRERLKNRERDRQAEEGGRRIEENRRKIVELIRARGEGAGAALDAEIERNPQDRTFLIPALETAVVSTDTLNRFSTSSDLGIVLTVVRNPRTPSVTLDRIYRTSTYPFYFFQALAENPHTPTVVLREIAAHPEPLDRSTIRRALARNPSTPPDLLQ